MTPDPRTTNIAVRSSTRPSLSAGLPVPGPMLGIYRRAVQRLGHTRAFAFALRRLGGARLDAGLYRRFNGRVSIAGPALFPILLLTTTGRRSGRRRTTPLIYLRDGDQLVVSSEHFGQARPASWPLNLDHGPIAVVRIGAVSARYRARRARPAEIERYWPALVDAWPAHETYRLRTGVRHVFVLEPHERFA